MGLDSMMEPLKASIRRGGSQPYLPLPSSTPPRSSPLVSVSALGGFSSSMVGVYVCMSALLTLAKELDVTFRRGSGAMATAHAIGLGTVLIMAADLFVLIPMLYALLVDARSGEDPPASSGKVKGNVASNCRRASPCVAAASAAHLAATAACLLLEIYLCLVALPVTTAPGKAAAIFLEHFSARRAFGYNLAVFAVALRLAQYVALSWVTVPFARSELQRATEPQDFKMLETPETPFTPDKISAFSPLSASEECFNSPCKTQFFPENQQLGPSVALAVTAIIFSSAVRVALYAAIGNVIKHIWCAIAAEDDAPWSLAEAGLLLVSVSIASRLCCSLRRCAFNGVTAYFELDAEWMLQDSMLPSDVMHRLKVFECAMTCSAAAISMMAFSADTAFLVVLHGVACVTIRLSGLNYPNLWKAPLAQVADDRAITSAAWTTLVVTLVWQAELLFLVYSSLDRFDGVWNLAAPAAVSLAVLFDLRRQSLAIGTGLKTPWSWF